MVQSQMNQFGYKLSADHEKGIEKAWYDATAPGDGKSASNLQVAKFVVNAWNVFLLKQ
jgi:hypothetical protein